MVVTAVHNDLLIKVILLVYNIYTIMSICNFLKGLHFYFAGYIMVYNKKGVTAK